MEKTQDTNFSRDLQLKDFLGNGFDGNGNNSADVKFELTPEELKQLTKDFI